MLFIYLPIVSATCQFFRCQDSSRVIPSSFINDNFCDCKDGSDEPDTAACPSNLFECPDKVIYSSKVGDGVCDCCDGSDEGPGICSEKCSEDVLRLNNKKLTKAERKKAMKKALEIQILNKAKERKMRQELEKIKDMKNDAEERRQFLEALIELDLDVEGAVEVNEIMEDVVKDLDEESRKIKKWLGNDFGKNFEFFDLYSKKLSFKKDGIEFKVLFYKSAAMEEVRKSLSLGTWSGFNSNYTAIKFVKGATCANNIQRSLTLVLNCSPVLSMHSIQEVSPCEYQGILELPNICINNMK